MYSESNRRTASRRANDEFLRRMLGGELTGDGYPVMNVTEHNTQPASPPARQERDRIPCEGSNSSDNAKADCPTHIDAPSLAMLYSPRQCWRNLFDPATGLSRGTIFADLYLPLEAISTHNEKEFKTRRPF